MSLVIPPGFGNAAFIFTSAVGTAPFVTTLGLDLSGVGGDFVAAANKAKSSYATQLASITSNTLTLDRVTLSIGNDGPGGSVDSDTAPVVMGATSASGPMAMSVIARKVTNQFGRYGRGRMFLPGVNPEQQIDPDGSVVAGFRTTVQTALTAFLTDLGNSTIVPLEPVLLHSSTTLGPPTPITNLVVSDLVGWIRGRIR